MSQEYDAIEGVLTHHKGLLRAAIDCQSAYLTLAAVLQDQTCRSVLADQLPAAADVQTRWRLMQIRLEDGKDTLKDACSDGGPLDTCTSMLAAMQAIFSQFGQLYATMRLTCPRLNLVSDAEILLAIAFGHTPADVSSSLLKACFPGVSSLVAKAPARATDAAVTITAVRGLQRDCIILEAPVTAGLLPLHEWLAHLEVLLKSSLRSHTKACLESPPELDPVHLSTPYPKQAVMLVDGVLHVRAVEDALTKLAKGSDRQAVRQLADETCAHLEALAERMVCSMREQSSTAASDPDGHLRPTSFNSCALEVLLLSTQAHRDTAEQLLREGVAAVSDWTWLRTVRHYWLEEAHDCHVCVGDACLSYGWEYSGGSYCQETMLLVHSDRAMMAAVSALQHSCVLALSPVSDSTGLPLNAAAGALAGALGYLLVHVDCVGGLGHLEIVRLLQVRCSPQANRYLLGLWSDCGPGFLVHHIVIAR